MLGLRRTIGVGLLTAAVTIAVEAPAYAAQPIWMEINQSYYLNTGGQITRVAVANPKIADVTILGASALNVIAFASGTTTLTIWTADGDRQEFQVVVSTSDSGIAAMIQQKIGLPGVTVEKIGNKIILSGTVKNQKERDYAVSIAAAFVPDSGEAKKTDDSTGGDSSIWDAAGLEGDDGDLTYPNIINLLEMESPDQINFEAMVIEISSNDAKSLGIQYGSSIGSTTSFGNEGIYFAGEGFGAQRDPGNHWYNRNWLFTHFSQINAQINALITNGKARVVSRPNITTMSGKNAGILIGGQMPYIVSGGTNSSDSVTFKDYGIQLNLIKPVVDRDMNITARLYAAVSRLDWSNAATSTNSAWPALATRSAETMVSIPSGMTMIIGGLLNSDDSKTLKKVPLLGSIPILGELFKYHDESKTKTEIMILITPRVVNASTPAQMSDRMKDVYQDARREELSRQEVDLNAPVPTKAEEEAKRAALNQANRERPKMSQQGDSMLGRYLDQDVLRKPSEEEKQSARK